jgi:hypothetical protein
MRRIGRMETELSKGFDSYTALLDDDSVQKKLDRLGRHHTRKKPSKRTAIAPIWRTPLPQKRKSQNDPSRLANRNPRNR